MKLRTINRFLRWTGWRLYVGIDVENAYNNLPMDPTQIGFQWYGWGFVKELDKDLVENANIRIE